MIDHIWGIVPDEYEKYTTKDRVFFNNSQTLDEDGKPVELKSLYLFYAPRYDTTNVDEIVIENENKTSGQYLYYPAEYSGSVQPNNRGGTG